MVCEFVERARTHLVIRKVYASKKKHSYTLDIIKSDFELFRCVSCIAAIYSIEMASPAIPVYAVISPVHPSIHQATENGDLSTVQLLLQQGHAVDERNAYKGTALVVAAINGRSEIAE